MVFCNGSIAPPAGLGLTLKCTLYGPKTSAFQKRRYCQRACPDTSGVVDLARDFAAIRPGNNFTLEKVKKFVWHL